MPQRSIIVVDGTAIRRGTSMYHSEEHRVLWVRAIEGTSVRLSTIDRTADIDRESFRKKVEDGTLVVEQSGPRPWGRGNSQA